MLAVKREERQFDCNDLCLQALHWSPLDPEQPEVPVAAKGRLLCLHGWLDNAGSFERLGPLLAAAGYELLAFDFAGNGRSTRRSLHGYYNLWDDLVDIRAILHSLAWDDYYVLGHSRGAIVAALHTATQPEGLSGLLMLDAIIPPPQDVESLPEQLALFMQDRDAALDKERQESASLQGFESMREAWLRRRKSCELEYEEMLPILERALEAAEPDSALRWTHDPRWLTRSLYRFSADDADAMLEGIVCPALLVLAQQGRMSSMHEQSRANFVERVKHLELLEHAGRHHFHLESANVESLAAMLANWLDSQRERRRQRSN